MVEVSKQKNWAGEIIDIFKPRVCVDDKLSMDVRIEFNIQQQKILGKLFWSVFKNSSV